MKRIVRGRTSGHYPREKGIKEIEDPAPPLGKKRGSHILLFRSDLVVLQYADNVYLGSFEFCPQSGFCLEIPRMHILGVSG